MSYLNGIKLASITTAILSAFITPYSLAAETVSNAETILDSSVKWEDIAGRSKLLESAPKWQDEAVKSLFNAYSNPTQYQLPLVKNPQQHNVQFINAFWGPLNNPFNKYQRPAKAFVMLSEKQKSDIFYMAPLVQNALDGNYYVFDKNQTQPVLLNDWVTNLRNVHGYKMDVRFNVCNGYGNVPTDICANHPYQEETSASTGQLQLKKSDTLSAQSAYRDRDEDWRSKAKMMQSSLHTRSGHIYSESISWNDVEARNKLLNTVVAWPNYNVIKDNFMKIRDIRYFQEDGRPDFMRRVTWLYPDDGCWTRAAAVIKDLFGPFNNITNHFSRPSKVFAFGNLCVNTTNEASGSVSWWYHTAPIVRDAKTNITYVLDPAVNPQEPMTMEKWVAEISSRTGACAGSKNYVSEFNICNGYGSAPHDSCEKTNYAAEAETTLGQSFYRHYERQRQVDLGRNADKVLGDLPPWLNTKA